MTFSCNPCGVDHFLRPLLIGGKLWVGYGLPVGRNPEINRGHLAVACALIYICIYTHVEVRFTTRCGNGVSYLGNADGSGQALRKPEHTARKTAVRRKRTLPLHVFQLKRGIVWRGKNGSFHYH